MIRSLINELDLFGWGMAGVLTANYVANLGTEIKRLVDRTKKPNVPQSILPPCLPPSLFSRAHRQDALGKYEQDKADSSFDISNLMKSLPFLSTESSFFYSLTH